MTQEEIIKHLHEALNSVDITFPYRYVLVEAIEALSQPSLPEGLEEAADKYAYSIYPSEGVANIEIYNAFIAGAEWMKAKMNWRSVEECLPEMDEEVIVLKDKQNTGLVYEIAFGHLVDTKRCIDYNGWNIPGVKFWMPMPKIPEE